MISGPRRSGKSSLIASMVKHVFKNRPHYLRLVAVESGPTNQRIPYWRGSKQDFASFSWVKYEPLRAFEAIPETITTIYRKGDSNTIIIEADSHPCIRNAFPYDCQIFTMPAPESMDDIFRTPSQTRDALKSVLHDTSAFACEVYGISDIQEIPNADPPADPCQKEHRPEMDEAEILEFLRSPMGKALALRIQCQPEYQGLTDNDCVVINMGTGGLTTAADSVVCALERIAEKACSPSGRKASIFCCDLDDHEDPCCNRLFNQLRSKFLA